MSPHTNLGMVVISGRLIALWASGYSCILQCLMLSVSKTFSSITVFDVYLLLEWYIRINTIMYINGVAVTDRRILLQNWVKTKILWDVITLFPFEVSLTLNMFVMNLVLSENDMMNDMTATILESISAVFRCVLASL